MSARRCRICGLPVSLPHASDCAAPATRRESNHAGDSVTDVNDRAVEGRRVYSISDLRHSYFISGGAR